MQENQQVKAVLAEVLNRNIASGKAFLKAGFIFLGKGVKNNEEISVFKFTRQ